MKKLLLLVLEQDGIKIIYLNQLVKNVDFKNIEYCVNDGFHPGRKAWDLIVPALVQNLGA